MRPMEHGRNINWYNQIRKLTVSFKFKHAPTISSAVPVILPKENINVFPYILVQ